MREIPKGCIAPGVGEGGGEGGRSMALRDESRPLYRAKMILLFQGPKTKGSKRLLCEEVGVSIWIPFAGYGLFKQPPECRNTCGY